MIQTYSEGNNPLVHPSQLESNLHHVLPLHVTHTAATLVSIPEFKLVYLCKFFLVLPVHFALNLKLPIKPGKQEQEHPPPAFFLLPCVSHNCCRRESEVRSALDKPSLL